jgi:hypothetical protein
MSQASGDIFTADLASKAASFVQQQKQNKKRPLEESHFIAAPRPVFYCECGEKLDSSKSLIIHPWKKTRCVIKKQLYMNCPNKNCKLRHFICPFTNERDISYTKFDHLVTSIAARFCKDTTTSNICPLCSAQCTWAAKPKDRARILYQHALCHFESETKEPPPKKLKLLPRCYDFENGDHSTVMKKAECDDFNKQEITNWMRLQLEHEKLDTEVIAVLNSVIWKQVYDDSLQYEFIKKIANNPSVASFAIHVTENLKKIHESMQAVINQKIQDFIQVPARYKNWTDFFDNDMQAHFILNDFLVNGVSVAQAGRWLWSLQNIYLRRDLSTASLLPTGMTEVMRLVNKLPLPKELIAAKKSKAPLYGFKERVARVMNTVELASQMYFHSPSTPLQQDEPVSEFYQTSAMREICKQCGSGVLPIVVLIFYDDFRKYRLAPGSCGGLYFTFLNFSRHLISKPKNIYALSLIRNKNDLIQALDKLVAELSDLNEEHVVYFAPTQANVKVRVFCQIVLGDMPQRHKTCCLKSHNSDNGACCNCKAQQADLWKDVHTSSQTGVDIYNVRTIEDTKKHILEYRNATLNTERENIAKKYGIKPYVNEKGNVIENPLWKLKDLYGFDLHEISVVDFFHVSILGLARWHFNWIYDNVLNASEKRTLEEILQREEFSVAGRNVTYLESSKFWNGDYWLRFLAVSCFAFSLVLGRDNKTRSNYYCWVQHMCWLNIMLQPQLSMNDIQKAEELCWEWRKQMRQLPDMNNDIVNIPNFHAILHVFPQARKFGPPVLYWARPFEHKHMVFRGYIENSNNRDVEKFSTVRDVILETIYYLFPSLKLKKPFRNPFPKRKLSERDYILFVNPTSSLQKRYAQILEITSDTLKIQEFTVQPGKTKRDKYHRCLILSTMQKQSPISISRSQVVGRFSVVCGYVNPFEVLFLL